MFPVVRTVAEGYRMVVQEWLLFEEAVETAGAGDLPQLLHHLRGMTTLTPPPALAPVPMDVQPQQGVVVEPSTAAQSLVKQKGLEKPVVVVVGENKDGPVLSAVL